MRFYLIYIDSRRTEALFAVKTVTLPGQVLLEVSGSGALLQVVRVSLGCCWYRSQSIAGSVGF